MNPRGLAAATVDLGLHGYTPERKVAFYTLAVERARQVPGVEIAAIGTHVPLARLNRLPMSRRSRRPEAMTLRQALASGWCMCRQNTSTSWACRCSVGGGSRRPMTWLRTVWAS
ncbi:MAG TPA: hypothetical protein VF981_06955 [Gemmatimonadaceae bacterium]